MCVCVCVLVCGNMYFFRLSRSIVWSDFLIRILILHSHVAVGEIEISLTPIHAAAPPAHSDRRTWPFIILLAIPQLTVGGFDFHFALHTCIGGF